MSLSEKTWKIFIVSISLIYVLLRFWDLTDSCLWFDEIFSVHAAEHPWSDMFWFIALDLIHPPFFYVLLKGWMTIGGESLFWLRSFPVFFSSLALLPFYFLCRRLKLNYQTIALALLIFTVNGCLIKYAQEIRMYSVLLCLSLFSMWLFVRYLELGKSFWVLTVVNIFLVHTHYFGWFIVLSEVLAILILQRIKIGKILIMFGINLAVFTVWFLMVWRASEKNAGLAQNIGWISKPNLSEIFQFVFDAIEPFYFQASGIDAASFYAVSIPIVLILIGVQIFYLVNLKEKDENEKRNFKLLILFVTIPVLITFAASWILPYSVWGTRHLIIIFAPLSILFAVYLQTIDIKSLKIGLITLILGLFVVAFALKIITPESKFIWCSWENLALNLDKNQSNKVFVFEDLTAYHFWFALRQTDDFIVTKVKNVDGLTEDKAYFLPRGFETVQTTEIEEINDQKFWAAFREHDWDEEEPPLRNLKNRGYKIGTPISIEAQGLKAFLVLIEK